MKICCIFVPICEVAVKPQVQTLPTLPFPSPIIHQLAPPITSTTLKKAKRKFWNTQFVLPTLSKINQKQNKIDIRI
jgi:hypothetical protein